MISIKLRSASSRSVTSLEIEKEELKSKAEKGGEMPAHHRLTLVTDKVSILLHTRLSQLLTPSILTKDLTTIVKVMRSFLRPLAFMTDDEPNI